MIETQDNCRGSRKSELTIKRQSGIMAVKVSLYRPRCHQNPVSNVSSHLVKIVHSNVSWTKQTLMNQQNDPSNQQQPSVAAGKLQGITGTMSCHIHPEINRCTCHIKVTIRGLGDGNYLKWHSLCTPVPPLTLKHGVIRWFNTERSGSVGPSACEQRQKRQMLFVTFIRFEWFTTVCVTKY